MITLYNTEKELFLSDYKPITGIVNGLNITECIELLDNLEKAFDNAYCYHSDLLASALYDDIASLKKHIFITLIKSYSSGTIASIIGSTKYSQIDKAVNKTLLFLYNAPIEYIMSFPVNNEGIKDMICKCYHTINDMDIVKGKIDNE